MKMSRTTYNDLEQALRAHVADETPGTWLDSWVIVSASMIEDDDTRTSYSYLSSPGPTHNKLGLLDLGQVFYASNFGRGSS